MQSLLKGFLFFGAIYLFFDSLIHFFDIKLLDVKNAWPLSAIEYARLLDKISGAFFLLIAIVAFVLYKNLEKYRIIVYCSAVWTLFLGLTFIFLGLSTNYSRAFEFISSLSFWLPFYRQYLFLEAGALILYSVVVFLWFRSRAR